MTSPGEFERAVVPHSTTAVITDPHEIANVAGEAGIRSDHECSDFEEAREKFARGQWIMIRQGTAAKNLKGLIGMFEDPYYQRCLLVTDDKHPGDRKWRGDLLLPLMEKY